MDRLHTPPALWGSSLSKQARKSEAETILPAGRTREDSVEEEEEEGFSMASLGDFCLNPFCLLWGSQDTASLCCAPD